MHITFAPRGILQIDDARITHKNFRGEGGPFNREGDRNFSIVIPDDETVEALRNDVNQYGVGWNVKVKDNEEYDEPLRTLPVKIKYKNGRGPAVYLRCGDSQTRLDESDIGILDKVDILRVDLDIRPYDDMFNSKPFRSAYLDSICVTQRMDRFGARNQDAPF